MSRVAGARVEINAPIERVWEIMTDLPGYGQWNPFIQRIQTVHDGARLSPGTELYIFTRWMDAQSGPVRRNRLCLERVDGPDEAATSASGRRTAVLKYRFAEWMAAAGVVRAVRTQTLQERPDGGTTYISQEVFTGILVAFVPLPRVQAGFDAHAAALKRAAELSADGQAGEAVAVDE